MHDAGGASAAAPLCPPAAAGRQLLSALRRASIVQAPHARVPFASPVAAGGQACAHFWEPNGRYEQAAEVDAGAEPTQPAWVTSRPSGYSRLHSHSTADDRHTGLHQNGRR